YLANLCLPADQVIGKTLFEVFPEQYARDFFAANERVLRTGKIDRTEDTLPLADGGLHTMSVFRFPIDDGQGRRSVGSIAIDVTERKQAEQRLRESEAKYRELIEQASDGIFVCDGAGRVLLANSRWCELVGYAQSEVTGMDSGQTYLDEERELFYGR